MLRLLLEKSVQKAITMAECTTLDYSSVVYFVLFGPFLHPPSHLISSSSFCHSTKLLIPKVTHKKKKKKKLKRCNELIWLLVKGSMSSFSLSFFPDFVQVPSSGTVLCIHVTFSVLHADTTMINRAKKCSSWITKCCRMPDLVCFTIIKSLDVIPVMHSERRTKTQLMYRTSSSNRQGTRFWAFTPFAAVLQLCVTFSKSLYCISVKYW